MDKPGYVSVRLTCLDMGVLNRYAMDMGVLDKRAWISECLTDVPRYVIVDGLAYMRVLDRCALDMGILDRHA